MKSNKPYLIRAFYEWIADNECTPYLAVNANFPRVQVPVEFIEDGQITLNISSEAVRDLKIGNEFLEFRASFMGVVHIVSVPIKAVLAIYAYENEQGMFFDFEEEDGDSDWEDQPTNSSSETSTVNKKRPSHLTLVE